MVSKRFCRGTPCCLAFTRSISASSCGTFTVKAGELVYIGHFGLDCYKEPTIWRYYPEGREGFDSYKQVIKKQYPFLDVDKMEFRLFKTSKLGRDYELPQ